jgi:hypothetical protein
MSSLDYAELAGLNRTLSILSIKQNKTEDEVIVENWIRQRIKDIKT